MSWKRISLETPEAANIQEPVTLDFVKQQVGQTIIDADDDLLAAYIAMARNYVETYTRRALVARTAIMVLDSFPAWEIVLPYGAAQSVTSIVYRDTSGAQQTLDGAASPAVFQTDLQDKNQAVIWPLRNSEWPTADPLSVDPVVVTWEAGYGAFTDVPLMLRLGIARQVARWYEARSDLEEPATVSQEFKRLIDPYTLIREA